MTSEKIRTPMVIPPVMMPTIAFPHMMTAKPLTRAVPAVLEMVLSVRIAEIVSEMSAFSSSSFAPLRGLRFLRSSISAVVVLKMSASSNEQ